MSQGFQGGPPPVSFASPGFPAVPPQSQPMGVAPVPSGMPTLPPMAAGMAPPTFAPPAFPATQVPPAAPPVAPVAPPVVQVAPQPQPVVVAEPPVSSQPQAAVEVQPINVPQLIKQFAKREGCDRYSGDGERIRLLTDYLWIRQLVPAFPLETFLDKYAGVANFDEENLKHPEDAIRKLLPRAKKQAEELKVHQWSAKEVVDFLCVYAEMADLADRTGQPVPMTLAEFIGNPEMQRMYLAGEFKGDESAAPRETSAPKRETRQQKAQEQAEARVVRPTSANQRVIMTKPDKSQLRGHTTRFFDEGGRQYVDFRSDAGEEFLGVGAIHCEVVNDPPPNPPQTDEGNEKPELGHAVLRIKKADGEQARQYLASPGPLGTVPIGSGAMPPFSQAFQNTPYAAAITIMNGETRPYVDSYLAEGSWENIVVDGMQPRENLEGEYVFELPHGYLRLEVRVNE